MGLQAWCNLIITFLVSILAVLNAAILALYKTADGSSDGLALGPAAPPSCAKSEDTEAIAQIIYVIFRY